MNFFDKFDRLWYIDKHWKPIENINRNYCLTNMVGIPIEWGFITSLTNNIFKIIVKS